MSRTSTATLDCQWDPYCVLDVQRDSRCVGWAHSQGLKCRHTVNWNDMSAFYGLLTELSSEPLDAAALQSDLRDLASLGLCKQVHRRAQVDYMVDKWTQKITTAARALQPETQHGRARTRSTTASLASTEALRHPGTHMSRSSTSTIAATPSATAQADIDSTLRCLEANREQERALMLRLASLQAPHAPRLDPIRPVTRVSTASVPSLHLSDTSRPASSRTPRSQTSTTAPRSSSAPYTSSQAGLSSSPDSSSPPNHRRPPQASADSPLNTQSTASRLPTVSSPPSISSALPDARPTASPPEQTSYTTAIDTSAQLDTVRRAVLQQRPSLLFQDFSALQTSQSTTNSSSPDHSIALLQQQIADLISLSPSSTPTAAPSSPPSPPRCTTPHVRRLPVSGECPICYTSMGEDAALAWCKGGCGQSVHKECMGTWTAHRIADGGAASCTMCRKEWTDECDC